MVPDLLRLTYERRKRGWSQTDLAERVQAAGGSRRLSTQGGISRLEVGLLTPTDAELNLLGEIFAVSPAFVLIKQLIVEDPHEHPSALTTAHVEVALAERDLAAARRELDRLARRQKSLEQSS